MKTQNQYATELIQQEIKKLDDPMKKYESSDTKDNIKRRMIAGFAAMSDAEVIDSIKNYNYKKNEKFRLAYMK